MRSNGGFVLEKTKDEELRKCFKSYFKMLDTAYHEDNLCLNKAEYFKKTSLNNPFSMKWGDVIYVTNIPFHYSMFMHLLFHDFFETCNHITLKNVKNNVTTRNFVGMKNGVVHSWYDLLKLKFTFGKKWYDLENKEAGTLSKTALEVQYKYEPKKKDKSAEKNKSTEEDKSAEEDKSDPNKKETTKSF